MFRFSRSRRIAGFVAGSALAAMVLSGCVPLLIITGENSSTTAPSLTSKPTGENVAPELKPFYDQALQWSSCGKGFQCTKASMPLDWANPSGETIELALVRQPASGKDRLGSLFVNPGGPGGSAYDFVKDSIDFAVDESLQQRYDIVGVDPRGVGRSAPVTCLSEEEKDSYIYDIFPGAPGTPEWLAAAAESAKDFGKACAAKTGPLLGHVDTESTVRDLDALRAAIGDKGLNFLGYSYGTFIGSQYADLFPSKINRMVLDGAVDPAMTSFEKSVGQAVGFESAMRAYLADCLTGSECPFSGSVDSAMKVIQNLLKAVDASPIRASDGRQLGSGSLLTAIVTPLYSQESWEYLSIMFDALKQGDADVAFSLADQYNSRNEDGSYADNSLESNIAINCLDGSSTTDPAVIEKQNAAVLAAAPTIGPWWTFGDIGCANWPYPGKRIPKPVRAEGSPTILVVGTTNDPATPYKSAVALAKQLERGQLITFEGEGHTAYGPSTCVKKIVNDYFLTGNAPTSDPQCKK